MNKLLAAAIFLLLCLWAINGRTLKEWIAPAEEAPPETTLFLAPGMPSAPIDSPIAEAPALTIEDAQIKTLGAAILSLVLLPVALYVTLNAKATAQQKQWAAGIIGALISYWLT